MTCSLMNASICPLSDMTKSTRAAPTLEITPAMTALLSKNTLIFDIVLFVIVGAFFIQRIQQFFQ